MKPRSINCIKDLKSQTNNLTSIITNSIKVIKESYNEDIISIKEDLINKICSDYFLDANELKRKYLRSKKKDNSKQQIEIQLEEDNKDKNFLENCMIYFKINHNNDYYFLNPKNNKIYDKRNNEVGIYKNNNFEINENLIQQIKLLENQLEYSKNNDTLTIMINSFLDNIENNIKQSL